MKHMKHLLFFTLCVILRNTNCFVQVQAFSRPSVFKSARVQRLRMVADTAIFTDPALITSVAAMGVKDNLDRRNLLQELPNEYDTEKIEKYYGVRPEKVLGRALLVGSKVAALTLVVLPTLLFFKDDTSASKSVRLKAFEILTNGISDLGPAFIKLGQTMAARPDIIGQEAADQLTKLQDSIPFFPNDIAQAKIQSQTGCEVHDLFQYFNSTPVAAASLGQVYKAEINGQLVAVKVQRPNLAETMAIDSLLIRNAAKTIMNVAKALKSEIKSNLTQAVDEFSCRLFEELNYQKEASNMLKFKQLYGSVEGIYIPEVFTNFSSREVIITEWIDGTKLVGEGSSLNAADLELLQLGIQCTLMQLLGKGFLHADPHGGNLLRTLDNKLAYLDFGLVSEIPPIVMDSLVIAVVHLINRDYKSLAGIMPGLLLLTAEDTEKDKEALSKALSDTFEPLFEEAAERGELFPRLAFSKLVDKLFGIAQSFSFVIPPYFLSNVRALAELEGMAMSADPEFNLVGVIYPFVVKRLLTDPSPALTNALDALITTPEGKVKWEVLGELLKAIHTSPKNDATTNYTSQYIVQFLLSEEGSTLKKGILEKIAHNLREKRKSHSKSGIIRKRERILQMKKALKPTAKRMKEKWNKFILPTFISFWKFVWVPSTKAHRLQLCKTLLSDVKFLLHQSINQNKGKKGESNPLQA